jgi:fumarylacetoacetase
MTGLNETHDPGLRSWVESANAAGTEFPIQNLPFGVFRRKGSNEAFRGGVAIGAEILDLGAAHKVGAFSGEAAGAAANCAGATLNAFMAMGPGAWAALRLALSRALREGTALEGKLRACLVPQAHAEHALPAQIGDYTDFYASVHHATTVGKMFRPDNPLLPNYKYVPIGYHGRASSIVRTGTPIRRPRGQAKPESMMEPVVGPSRRLDYEIEVGFFVGPGNALGEPIPIADVEQHLFGVCLVNDWSARDLQAWEYQPLGPFLAKNFATTVSPWVVTFEALEPFRVPAFIRPDGDPDPLPYLDDPRQRERGGIDLRLEVSLSTEQMRSAKTMPFVLSRNTLRHLYWTPGQLLTHHASGGCNMRPGDLLASGTVSGPTRESRGCFLELAWRGEQPITLPTGETRAFLEDGDEVIFRGWCEREGWVRIGTGEARGVVVPA